ncbi:MAG: hypothetical protein ACHQK8_08370 [Bacteroidia bacterium]
MDRQPLNIFADILREKGYTKIFYLQQDQFKQVVIKAEILKHFILT